MVINTLIKTANYGIFISNMKNSGFQWNFEGFINNIINKFTLYFNITVSPFGMHLQSENKEALNLCYFLRWVQYLQLTFVFTILVSVVLENLPAFAFAQCKQLLPSKNKCTLHTLAALLSKYLIPQLTIVSLLSLMKMQTRIVILHIRVKIFLGNKPKL